MNINSKKLNFFVPDQDPKPCALLKILFSKKNLHLKDLNIRRNNTMKNHKQIQFALKSKQLMLSQIKFAFLLKESFLKYKDVKDEEMVSGVDVYWILHNILNDYMDMGDLIQDYMELTEKTVRSRL